MSEESEVPSPDGRKKKGQSPTGPCSRCGTKVANGRGGLCKTCVNLVRDERDAAFKVEVEKGEVPADLLCLRWVQQNVGQDISQAATDKRRYYRELFERSVKEFHAAAEKAEAEFAASKQVAAGPKARADEGLDRCIQIARDWLRDNAPEGK